MVKNGSKPILKSDPERFAQVSYGMSKKLKNLKGPIPTCSSPSDRVIYISKDAYLNVEYDVNCFQLEFLT